MFQRMYDSLPTSVLERVGVVRELLCVRYGIARRLCLAWTKWILLYNFYACSNQWRIQDFTVGGYGPSLPLSSSSFSPSSFPSLPFSFPYTTVLRSRAP